MYTYITNKIATIVPIAHLNLIDDHEHFMVLAHLLANPAYAEFYEHKAMQGKYVVLDNSTVELGEPMPFRPYLETAMSLDATEIVLPDYLHNSHRTLVEVELALRNIDAYGWQGLAMGVPQGNTQQEWVDCLNHMLNMGVGSIGISRRYRDMFGASRLFSCYVARMVMLAAGREVGIHLLGCGGPPEEDIAPCLMLPYVHGVDSAWPSYFTRGKANVAPGKTRPDSGSLNFSEILDEELLAENINLWRKACISDYPMLRLL